MIDTGSLYCGIVNANGTTRMKKLQYKIGQVVYILDTGTYRRIESLVKKSGEVGYHCMGDRASTVRFDRGLRALTPEEIGPYGTS